MAEIDNYEDSSAQATDDVESTEENTNSGDEETSGDSRYSGDEDDDPLSLPTCARKISAYPRDAKMKKVLQKSEKFYYKVTKNRNISSSKLLSFIRGTRLNKEQKLKCSLVCLKKQSEVYKKRGNASYALYGFPWAFLVWIYEAFPHLGNYAKKSLDSPLPIPRYLDGTRQRAITLSKVVQPYLVHNVRETKQNYMATLKP
ncbi:hypothetical protein KY289_037296 [Solanum tuberosum]|nr:hypothetical protein KY289_037296 [Solanum tuberosum]